METKTCRICHIVKKLEEFNKKSSSKDGFRNDCKQCRIQFRKEVALLNVDLTTYAVTACGFLVIIHGIFG